MKCICKKFKFSDNITPKCTELYHFLTYTKNEYLHIVRAAIDVANAPVHIGIIDDTHFELWMKQTCRDLNQFWFVYDYLRDIKDNNK